MNYTCSENSEKGGYMTSRYHLLLGFVALTFMIIASPAEAQQTRPIQLSLVTPIQIFQENDPISGVRLNLIYGRSVSVVGLDLGLANHTTTGFTKGVQWGVVNMVDTDFMGWQDATVNVTKKNFEGFQSGFVNYAHYVSGFQLGIVNYAGSMKGLQIGLVNIIKQGGQFPVFPIINWSF
jgi:hypothetical protein